MYRKLVIKDLEGKKVALEIHPDQNDLIKTQKSEIHMTFKTHKNLSTFISAMTALMDGNTINKIEVEEIT